MPSPIAATLLEVCDPVGDELRRNIRQQTQTQAA
jgi:hypothetical protein